MKRYLPIALLLISIVAIAASSRVSAQGGRGMRPMDPASAARMERLLAPLARLTPVTPAMLQNPSPNDWLLWRRTYDGHGFSPLTQINRNNVRNLRVAWTVALAVGDNEFTPLVHDGIMFVWDYGDRVQAIDATTGSILWRYSHTLPTDLKLPTFARTKKHFGIHGNKLLFATTDLHLIALDVKTGTLIYDQVVDDYETQFSYNAGPLVIKDKVLIGMTNTLPLQRGRKAALTGHDVETGKELWRFYTVPIAGESGGNTWNGLPDEKRWGGAMWVSGSYDPELNLTYWGTGQAYPWSAYDRGTAEPVADPQMTRELLYTNSTLALNPDTGKLVWYYSHLPNDHWDHDYAFERVIVNIPFGGRTRKVVMTMGKNGILEALDAATGEFIFAKDNGVQNVIKQIDPKTGVKTYIEFARGDRTTLVCPQNGGAKSWPAGAYSPLTKAFYIGLNENCVGPEAGKMPAPWTPNGELGRLDAIGVDSQKTLWQYRDRAPMISAILATAGGLVFAGSYDRYLRAFDDQTGKILWQMRVNDVPNAFPISYAYNGKQYIAMSIGSAALYGVNLTSLTPELAAVTPSRNTVLWAFELP